MKITIVSIGTKLPDWINQGVDVYARRFKSMMDYSLTIKEIPAKKRHKNANINKIIAIESQALIDAVPKNNNIIALDVGGQRLSSEKLANKLSNYHDSGENITVLIGGPEGFNDSVRAIARECWSLSDLTLPHPIARIILVETLYRSISILHNHPYHRGL